ncbi:MAG: DUF4965 domain-containing protein [Prevotella sp.]|nr:DUF4965 domain-containing protein [Prevotella sp.]
MRRILTWIAALALAATANAQKAEYFAPYKATNLRLPSVPIFVNDPYVSFWSSYDKLTDGDISYWYSRDRQKPIRGMLRVDGKTYRFMGAERQYILNQAILPMADTEAWTAPVSFTKQSGTAWAQPDFDDSAWQTKQGAIGVSKEYPNVKTEWSGDNTDVYVRRTMTLTADDIKKDLYVKYSHDDVFELYINGHRVVQTGETWLQGEIAPLTEEAKASLKEGDNIVAAHCHNTTGGAYIDFGIYENTYQPIEGLLTAEQKSVDVMATNTYYTLTCGPVDLDLVFTAPMLIDDLDLLSTPINYISYQVRSNDGAEHDVQLYIATSAKLTVANDNTATRTIHLSAEQGYKYIQASSGKTIPHETGSYDCIDWGRLYLPDFNGTISLENPQILEQTFSSQGTLPEPAKSTLSPNMAEAPEMAYLHDFGKTTSAASFMMIGYDEVNDIVFLDKTYKGYWARNGKTIFEAFQEMADNYDDIMTRCRQLDQRIYDDALQAANQRYAELLSASYRQTIAAHKLFEDNDGDLMFFSRENDSGGFINTVDVTYPSLPLFYIYNHDLARAMVTSVFKYCESNRWGFNFANHDLGHYPIANNQHYSIRFPNAQGGFEGNMPIEESGNLVIITANLVMLDKDASYAERFWKTLTTWANYLADNGQDPENQLCTDDFAGHLAHNVNLSVKAIMGVAGYAIIAKKMGLDDVYEKYMAKAKEMAATWEKNSVAADDSHYRLTFDGNDNTWSLKYNLVWDKMWQTKLFSDEVYTREVAYYLTMLKKYGVPLDSRKDYTKSDWLVWAASLADNKSTFARFANLVYSYVNNTASRVPISDWYWTTNGNLQGFRARSVVGGHWMKVMMDKFQDLINKETGIAGPQTNTTADTPAARYNLNGQKLAQPEKGVNIIRYNDGSTKKVVVR